MDDNCDDADNASRDGHVSHKDYNDGEGTTFDASDRHPVVAEIAYSCYVDNNDDICIIGADGSNRRRLTENPYTDFYPSRTADGTVVAYSSQRLDGTFRVFFIEPETGRTEEFAFSQGKMYAPEVAPDGRRLVFTVEDLTGGQDIWMSSVDGSETVRLTYNGVNVDPTWSPDGSMIAFSTLVPGRSGHQKAIAELDTGRVRVLDLDIADMGGRVDWSPDGQWLAIYAGPRNNRDIYLASPHTQTVRRLTDGGNNVAPSFSPSGTQIAFASSRDGDLEIFLMDLNGGNVRQLTHNSYPDWQPRW